MLPLRKAKVIGVYLALPKEPRTADWIKLFRRHGQQVAVPVTAPELFFSRTTRRTRYQKSRLGTQEPVPFHRVAVPWSRLDALLIPGLAFDPETGARLGRGGGIFDDVISRTPRACHIGVCFEVQCLPGVPAGSRDQRVNFLVSEKRILKF